MYADTFQAKKETSENFFLSYEAFFKKQKN